MPETIRSLLKERKPIGFYLHANWIFSTLIEKVGLMIMIALGTWKIIEFIVK